MQSTEASGNQPKETNPSLLVSQVTPKQVDETTKSTPHAGMFTPHNVDREN
jgi:hypothetical protein